MSERKERCETCRFFDQEHNGDGMSDDEGECHRFPPLAATGDAKIPGPPFPMVQRYDWCGEWQPIPPPGPDPALLDKSVDDLGFSTRVRKAFWRECRLGDYHRRPGQSMPIEAPIKTLRDLISHSAEELMEVPLFGIASLTEIRTKLRSLGLHLRDDNS